MVMWREVKENKEYDSTESNAHYTQSGEYGMADKPSPFKSKKVEDQSSAIQTARSVEETSDTDPAPHKNSEGHIEA